MHLKNIFLCLGHGSTSQAATENGNQKEIESQQCVPERGSQWLQFIAAMSGEAN